MRHKFRLATDGCPICGQKAPPEGEFGEWIRSECPGPAPDGRAALVERVVREARQDAARGILARIRKINAEALATVTGIEYAKPHICNDGVCNCDAPPDYDAILIAARKRREAASTPRRQTQHVWDERPGLLFSKRLCLKCKLNGADIRDAVICDGPKAARPNPKLHRALSLDPTDTPAIRRAMMGGMGHE